MLKITGIDKFPDLDIGTLRNFNKFSREEFSRTPFKARLCISERSHHDKSRIEGQDRIAGQNRGQTQTQNRGL